MGLGRPRRLVPFLLEGVVVRRYRTEIVIPADRTVVLQLPAQLPEGLATVIIQVESDEPVDSILPDDATDLDHEDIEWWEEFGGDGPDLEPANDEPLAEADADLDSAPEPGPIDCTSGQTEP